MRVGSGQMRVAVTGITGSFGRAFARRVLSDGIATRLVGLSRDELKQSELAEEFKHYDALRLFLGDVRDERRLEDAFYHCDVVVHAAALKRVDATAYNPSELAQTNVQGTLNVVRAAMSAGVQRVLFISSDKAVAPTNIYGSSKSLAEQICVSMNSHSHPRGTLVSVLRYGNVLASRGSVAHIWRAQHARHEQLTITDHRMTRFVLNLNQAVSYALHSLEIMRGGEVFIPKLPSATIRTYAESVVGSDVEFRVIGMRPGGEKLHEALLTSEEVTRTRDLLDMYMITPSAHTWTCDAWPGELVDQSLSYTSQDGLFGWATSEQVRRLIEEDQS